MRALLSLAFTDGKPHYALGVPTILRQPEEDEKKAWPDVSRDWRRPWERDFSSRKGIVTVPESTVGHPRISQQFFSEIAPGYGAFRCWQVEYS